MTNKRLCSLKKKWILEGYKLALKENASDDVIYEVTCNIELKKGISEIVFDIKDVRTEKKFSIMATFNHSYGNELFKIGKKSVPTLKSLAKYTEKISNDVGLQDIGASNILYEIKPILYKIFDKTYSSKYNIGREKIEGVTTSRYESKSEMIKKEDGWHYNMNFRML